MAFRCVSEILRRHHCEMTTNDMSVVPLKVILLWFLFNPRINLSPFTKDFRGEEHYNESID